MKVFKLYNERDTKLVHRAFSQAGLSFTFETNKSKEPHSPHHSIFEVEASLTIQMAKAISPTATESDR